MTNMELATLLAPIGAGVLGGVAGGKSNDKALQQSQQQMAFQQLVASILNQQQTEQGMQGDRQNRAGAALAAQPLGQEQAYINKQRMMQQALPALSRMQIAGPTNPNIANKFTPVGNPAAGMATPQLMQGFGDQATQQALADRRRAISLVSPESDFGDVSAYGLNNNDVSGKVHPYQEGYRAQLGGYEAQQRALAEQQRTLAMGNYTAANQQQQQGQQKDTPWWKKILPAVAGGAAAFIPGVGPLLAPVVGGAVGGLVNGTGGAVTGALAGLGGEFAQGKFFNGGGGPQLNNAMTPQSFPVSSMPSQVGVPQTLPLQSSYNQVIQSINPSVGQNRPFQGPAQPPPNPRGPQAPQGPQGYAPNPSIPFAPSHGGAQPPMGRADLQRSAIGGAQLTPSQMQEAYGPASLAYINQAYPDPQQAITGVLGSLPFMRGMLGGGAQAAGSASPSMGPMGGGFRGPIPGTGGPVGGPQGLIGGGQRMLPPMPPRQLGVGGPGGPMVPQNMTPPPNTIPQQIGARNMMDALSKLDPASRDRIMMSDAFKQLIGSLPNAGVR